MKKVIITTAIASMSLCGFAQIADSALSPHKNESFNKLNPVLNTRPLLFDETAAGIKEALLQGVNKSTSRLSAADGYFKDGSVKIGLPDDVKKMEPKLRALGMGKVLDQAVESMNRAAEDAAKSAPAVFTNTVKGMKVTDATAILKGSDTAATLYLKKMAYSELTNALSPVIESSLKKMNTAKYWGETYTLYNKVSPQLTTGDMRQYVTERAFSGIFYYIGEEEKKIRNNTAARESDLLKKVFANQ